MTNPESFRLPSIKRRSSCTLETQNNTNLGLGVAFSFTLPRRSPPAPPLLLGKTPNCSISNLVDVSPVRESPDSRACDLISPSSFPKSGPPAVCGWQSQGASGTCPSEEKGIALECVSSVISSLSRRKKNTRACTIPAFAMIPIRLLIAESLMSS